MNPFKEILNRASKVFSDDGEPALARIHPELRSILYNAEPGEFNEAIKTVNALLMLNDERSLTREEIDDAEQVNYLTIPR